MSLAAQLALLAGLTMGPLLIWRWGFWSACIRVGFLLVLVYYLVSLWHAYPQWHGRVQGALLLLIVAVFTGRRMPLFGPRRARGGGGGSWAPVVPRQGGGWVNGPRPFNAGGRRPEPTVVVVAGRGHRAARGVRWRMGRFERRLEEAGMLAADNLREGRLPFRRRAQFTYISMAAWFEAAARMGRRRAVDRLREDVDEGGPGMPGTEPGWVPGWMQGPVDRLRGDWRRGR